MRARRSAIPDGELYDRRSFYVLIFAVFAAFVGFTNVAPLLPLYVLSLGVESIQDAAFWTGIVLGVSPLISAISAPFWGMMADRYGHKLIIQRSLFGFSVLFIPMAFAATVWQLFALRALVGLVGGFQAQSMALAAALVPKSQLPRAIASVQLAQVLGSAVGPLLGGFVGDHYGFVGAVLVAAVLTGVAAVVVTGWLREPSHEVLPAGARPASFRSLFALAGFVPMLLVVGLVRYLDRSFDPLIPLLVVQLEPQASNAGSLAGLIIGLGTLATAASAFLAGRIGSRSQNGGLLTASLIGGGLLCLPFLVAATAWHVLIIRLVLGLVAGGAITLAMSFAAQDVPSDRRGLAFGMLGSAGLYGNALGAIGAGMMASTSFELPFLAGAGLYALAAIAVRTAGRQRASATSRGTLRPDTPG